MLRDRGDYGDAETVLAQALDVCERAGLIAQSIQAMSSRALILALGGRMEQAREAALEASDLADRLHYPVGHAAALEAQGATAEDLDKGNELLEQAAAAWTEIGRPLDAARCRLALGKRLAKCGDPRTREMLEAVADELDSLGVPHLAAVAQDALAGRLGAPTASGRSRRPRRPRRCRRAPVSPGRPARPSRCPGRARRRGRAAPPPRRT